MAPRCTKASCSVGTVGQEEPSHWAVHETASIEHRTYLSAIAAEAKRRYVNRGCWRTGDKFPGLRLEPNAKHKQIYKHLLPADAWYLYSKFYFAMWLSRAFCRKSVAARITRGPTPHIDYLGLLSVSPLPMRPEKIIQSPHFKDLQTNERVAIKCFRYTS